MTTFFNAMNETAREELERHLSNYRRDIEHSNGSPTDREREDQRAFDNIAGMIRLIEERANPLMMVHDIQRVELTENTTIVFRLGCTAEQLGGGTAWIPSPSDIDAFEDHIVKVWPAVTGRSFITHFGCDIVAVEDSAATS